MNDAHDLFINWASDIKTNEYLTFKCHDTEENNKKVISYWLKKYEENGFEWCIEIKDTKEVIGAQIMDFITNRDQTISVTERLEFTSLKKAIVKSLSIVEDKLK